MAVDAGAAPLPPAGGPGVSLRRESDLRLPLLGPLKSKSPSLLRLQGRLPDPSAAGRLAAPAFRPALPARGPEGTGLRRGPAALGGVIRGLGAN